MKNIAIKKNKYFTLRVKRFTETFMRIYGRLNCFIKKEEATEAVRIAEERNIHVLNALLTLYNLVC